MQQAPKNKRSQRASTFFYSLDFFKLLPEKTRELLAGELQSVSVAGGDLVIRQGDLGDSVYFIEQGRCDILVENEDGRQFKVAERGLGEMVGEMALVTEEPRQAHVVAATII